MKSVSLTVNLEGPTPNDPKSIFHQGQSFFLAGNRCLLDIEVGPGVTQCLVSPGVVNLCLAIELFLKSTVVLKGVAAPKTHKLAELFAACPATTIAEVKSTYEQTISNPTLDDLLSQINEFFVQVRYGYEFDVFAYHEYPVYTLAKILYKHSADLHKIKVGLDRIRL